MQQRHAACKAEQHVKLLDSRFCVGVERHFLVESIYYSRLELVFNDDCNPPSIILESSFEEGRVGSPAVRARGLQIAGTGFSF